jgi:hypothetical protein
MIVPILDGVHPDMSHSRVRGRLITGRFLPLVRVEDGLSVSEAVFGSAFYGTELVRT